MKSKKLSHAITIATLGLTMGSSLIACTRTPKTQDREKANAQKQQNQSTGTNPQTGVQGTTPNATPAVDVQSHDNTSTRKDNSPTAPAASGSTPVASGNGKATTPPAQNAASQTNPAPANPAPAKSGDDSKAAASGDAAKITPGVDKETVMKDLLQGSNNRAQWMDDCTSSTNILTDTPEYVRSLLTFSKENDGNYRLSDQTLHFATKGDCSSTVTVADIEKNQVKSVDPASTTSGLLVFDAKDRKGDGISGVMYDLTWQLDGDKNPDGTPRVYRRIVEVSGDKGSIKITDKVGPQAPQMPMPSDLQSGLPIYSPVKGATN